MVNDKESLILGLITGLNIGGLTIYPDGYEGGYVKEGQLYIMVHIGDIVITENDNWIEG
jgi:hypothetical protein